MRTSGIRLTSISPVVICLKFPNWFGWKNFSSIISLNAKLFFRYKSNWKSWIEKLYNKKNTWVIPDTWRIEFMILWFINSASDWNENEQQLKSNIFEKLIWYGEWNTKRGYCQMPHLGRGSHFIVLNPDVDLYSISKCKAIFRIILWMYRRIDQTLPSSYLKWTLLATSQ